MFSGRSLRRIAYFYFFACAALVVASLATGYRVSTEYGEPHYLLTRTSILVERPVEPDNPTDAELDAMFADDSGGPATQFVEEPVFVIGLLDVTFPIVVAGGVAMLIAAAISRRRRGRAKAVVNSSDDRVS
jgi:hypothetical protein